MNILRTKILIFLFPIILFFIFLNMKLFSHDVYRSIIQEDTVIENMQAITYFLSSVVALLISLKFLHSKIILNGVLYSLLAVGLFFVAMEEISWGQRIFKIETPVYFDLYNAQKELSIHNLNIVQSKLHRTYVIVGAYGSFSWIFASLILSRVKKKYHHIIVFLAPDWFISSYFFFCFLIYSLFCAAPQHIGHFIIWRDQEPCELLLSFGFLAFVVTNYFKSRLFLEPSAKAKNL
jgi:hypothetical protein